MKKELIVFTFVCLCLSLFGQRPGARQGRPTSFPVTGLVLDKGGDYPLEYATISVYADDKLITGTVTDLDGRFSLQLPARIVRLEIEYISYEPLTVNELTIAKGGEIGPFYLQADAEVLETVEVTAERSQVQMQLDKKVFNVGRDINSRAGNAQDVLDNVPSVTVDIEGNVELRGNGNVRVLINGRPSGVGGVRGANALRSIQASQIERIEVVTNPSARFEAEGMAGIINIVLKKNRAEGFNASFDVQAGYPKLAGLGANLNYRKGKINWFANLSGRNNRAPGSGSSNRIFTNGQTPSRTTQERRQFRGGTQGSFQGGIDYSPTDNDNLTASIQYEKAEDNNDQVLLFEDYDLNNVVFRGIERLEDEIEKENELSYNLSYTRQFSKGHTFKTDFQYADQSEDEASDFINNIFNGPIPEPRNNPDDVTLERAANVEGETRYRYQADYERPLWENGKFETGILGNWRTVTNDFNVFKEENGTLVLDPRLSNELLYTENIYAAYATLGSSFNDWSISGGLRVEYSDIKTELLDTDEVNPRDFTNVFPSLFISRKLNDVHSVQVSYSRRIRRPRFFELNPFLTFSDNRNVFGGNPDLNPEFTDSYEFNHIAYLGEITLSSGAFFRHTTDVIQRIVIVDDNESARTIPANVATQESYGLEMNISGPITPWLQLTMDGNLFGFTLKGQYEGEVFDTDDIAGRGRATLLFKLPSSIDAQVRYAHRGASENVQGRRRAINTIDIGLSRDILSGRGTVTFNVRDLLNSRRRISENEGPGFIFNSEFQWRERQWTVAFNYRLNQKKKRGRSGGNFEGGEF